MFGSFGKPQNKGFDNFSECSEVRSDFHISDHQAGGKTNLNLKFRDTISELYDDKDKNAVFQSSMKKGGAMHEFNQSKMMSMSFLASPQNNKENDFLSALKSPEPQRPSHQQTKKGFVFEKKDHPVPKQAAAFRKEIPSEFSNLKKPSQISNFQPQNPNFMKDEFKQINDGFGLKPKPVHFCKKHRDCPIEFFCQMSNEFFCRLCAKNHSNHHDICIAEVSQDLQNNLVELKHTYLTKRTHIFDRLVEHQNKIESFFNIYYTYLDEQRKEMLSEEYNLRALMDSFEIKMKKMIKRCQQYSVIEFFMEQDELKSEVNKMKKQLNNFSIYMPKIQLKNFNPDDADAVTKSIKEQLSEKLKQNLVPIDNSFALENFEYATKELGNQTIQNIYTMLGPFDFSQYKPPSLKEEKPEDSDDEPEFDPEFAIEMEYYWIPRKSGAQYRGEVRAINKRPDGKGIKVFKNSLYEGYFSEGRCHGLGRGISSKGEIYQGMFVEDQMEGYGFFYWPDGRIYEGNWLQGKKHGIGCYFWTNGQVYEGEFKNDDCNGYGIQYYPDGKRYEGNWKAGNKHGKGVYIFPNGALYQVVYAEGRKIKQGQLERSAVSTEQMRKEYQSLAKKSLQGKEFMKRFDIGGGDPVDFNQTNAW